MNLQSPTRGCVMCDSLYVKANGEMPCWDDVGESRILRKLVLPDLMAGREHDLFADSRLVEIRRSFMNQTVPFPGLCECCAVRQHGPAALSLRPAEMRILHVEPSYLCHLSCPQCIPASQRKGLVDPPYHMGAQAFKALLQQLQTDGVRAIGCIHFEGRGDPLMNGSLGEMIRMAREMYPGATTIVTTHGSYAYKPEILRSGLRFLRVSIDGAFPESYEKYRIGGDLRKAFKFLEQLRDDRRQHPNNLTVWWKYILFEWNDSDEEMQHAAALAEDFEVSLLFTLTHTPGASKRFTTEEALRRRLRRVAPKALTDSTFPLRDSLYNLSETEREVRIVTLLRGAKALIDKDDERSALGLIYQALELDCRLRPENYLAGRTLALAYVPLVLRTGQHAATLSNLAEILHLWGESNAARSLLEKYLRTVQGMPMARRLWLFARLRLRFRTRLRAILSLLPSGKTLQKSTYNSR